jgi:hypothetical protein
LVAIVIGIVLFATIMFNLLKRYNILKKIKILLKPRGEEDIEKVTSQDCGNDTENSIITVEERFVSPARPIITSESSLFFF